MEQEPAKGKESKSENKEGNKYDVHPSAQAYGLDPWIKPTIRLDDNRILSWDGSVYFTGSDGKHYVARPDGTVGGETYRLERGNWVRAKPPRPPEPTWPR